MMSKLLRNSSNFKMRTSGSDEIRTRDPLLVREVSYH